MSLFVIETTNTNMSFDCVATVSSNGTIRSSERVRLKEGLSFNESVECLLTTLNERKTESIVFNILDFDDVDRYVDAIYELSKTLELSIGLRTKHVKNPSKLEELGIEHIIDNREQESLDIEECDYIPETRCLGPEPDAIVNARKRIRKEKTIVMYSMAMPTPDKSFREKLIQYINRSGKSNADIYKCAGITKQVYSKIISSESYEPKKTTIICLIIGLKLDMDDALDLLNAAGYTLSRSKVLDLVIMDAIESKQYDIIKINESLLNANCPLIGWNPRD